MELLRPHLPTSPQEANAWLCDGTRWEQEMPANGLAARLADDRPLRVKLGLDPTMPSLHLGHLLVLQRLRWFQIAGHEVIVILGDFTASIGDPSGRTESRPMLDAMQIEAATEAFREQLGMVLDMEQVRVRRNSEWLRMETPAWFALLRHVTVSQLLGREDFSRRLADNQPLSVLELMYPIAQALDSVEISADVEMGGSDQTVNFALARDLQRAHGLAPQVCLTLPILVGIDGQVKMSKSLDNIVSLAHRPEDVIGRSLRLPDAAVDNWAQLLFGVSLAEQEPWVAKQRLAASVCELIHPGQGLAALSAWKRVHAQGEQPNQMAELVVTQPVVHLPALLAEAFAITRGEARRKLAEGAIRLDGQPLQLDGLDVPAEQLWGRALSIGRRRWVRIKAGDEQRDRAAAPTRD